MMAEQTLPVAAPVKNARTCAHCGEARSISAMQRCDFVDGTHGYECRSVEACEKRILRSWGEVA